MLTLRLGERESALRLSGRLDAFICYDARLAEAARAVGLTVEAPA